MQKVTDTISFLVDRTPSLPGHVVVWVDTEDCVTETNFTIYLSSDNRTRVEREPLYNRLVADMKDILPAYGRMPVCFASTDETTARFAALFYAGLCGVKLAPVWARLVETTTEFKDERGTSNVPLYHMTNASFRLILSRFK